MTSRRFYGTTNQLSYFSRRCEKGLTDEEVSLMSLVPEIELGESSFFTNEYQQQN
jgi:hypothetical protein